VLVEATLSDSFDVPVHQISGLFCTMPFLRWKETHGRMKVFMASNLAVEPVKIHLSFSV
jgi:hypothetical protein